MKARILLLITDLELGGTPTVVRELAKRLHDPPAVEVQVACLAPMGPVGMQIQSMGIAVTPLNARSALDLRALYRLCALCRRSKFDTVFSFLLHANFAASVVRLLLPQLRLIQSIQTCQPTPRWHWRLQTVVSRLAARIVVPSQSVAAAARSWSHVPGRLISVIPNAVDAATIQRRPDNGGKRIVFLGRLDPIKRVDDLLAAMQSLPGYTLHIFGDGLERARLEQLASVLKVTGHVMFHGPVEDASLALQNASVLVLPSDAEGFGLVLIEAMAAGVPVIGSQVAGIVDVIEPGVSGLLVPVRSPRALAAAISHACEDQVLRQTLIAGGHARVRAQFTWDSVIKAYRQLILPVYK